MAVDYNIVAEKIFRILKGRGYSVQLFDAEDGNEIVDPQTARFFYIQKPNLMVNLSIENNEIKLHKGPESIDEVASTVASLKKLAKDNLLDFDLREFGREIKPKNYSFRLNNNMEQMKTEGYSAIAGTVKTSTQKLENAKLLIKHRSPVNEEIPGARSRNISALYIENGQGERFKYPFIHLNGARAMTRHVQNGGNLYDEVGQSIVNMSEQMSKIREVLNVMRRSPAIQEQGGSVYNSMLARQDRLRETIKRLTTIEGYNNYVETFTRHESKEYDQDTLNKLKEKFTVSTMDNRVAELLPMIQEIHDEEINDNASLRNRIAKELEKGPIEMHPRSAGQSEYSPSNIMKFNDSKAELAYKISDLAARAKNDEVSVFLARMSDKLTGIDKDPMVQDDVATIRSILAKVKEPADQKDMASNESKDLPELSKLDESFDRILGMYSDTMPFEDAETLAKAKDKFTYIGKNVNPKVSYNSWLKDIKSKEIDDPQLRDRIQSKGAYGVSGSDHAKWSQEYRAYKAEAEGETEAPVETSDIPHGDFSENDAADLEHDFEEYRDAVHDSIKNDDHYKGKSKEEIIDMLRKEADSIGYADVTDGDRHPSEPEWLNRIADEMSKEDAPETVNAENMQGTVKLPPHSDELARMVALSGIK